MYDSCGLEETTSDVVNTRPSGLVGGHWAESAWCVQHRSSIFSPLRTRVRSAKRNRGDRMNEMTEWTKWQTNTGLFKELYWDHWWTRSRPTSRTNSSSQTELVRISTFKTEVSCCSLSICLQFLEDKSWLVGVSSSWRKSDLMCKERRKYVLLFWNKETGSSVFYPSDMTWAERSEGRGGREQRRRKREERDRGGGEEQEVKKKRRSEAAVRHTSWLLFFLLQLLENFPSHRRTLRPRPFR